MPGVRNFVQENNVRDFKAEKANASSCLPYGSTLTHLQFFLTVSIYCHTIQEIDMIHCISSLMQA